MSTTPRMTSTAEVGAALGVTDATVIRWAQDGVIEAVQPVANGKWLVPVTEIDRLLDQARANRARKAESTALRVGGTAPGGGVLQPEFGGGVHVPEGGVARLDGWDDETDEDGWF